MKLRVVDFSCQTPDFVVSLFSMAQPTTQNLVFAQTTAALHAFEVLVMHNPLFLDQPLNFSLPVQRVLRNTLSMVERYKTLFGLDDKGFTEASGEQLVAQVCNAAAGVTGSLFACDGWMGNFLLQVALLVWAQQGFPYLEVEEKTCAYLVGTHVTGEVLGDIVAPWSCFLVVLPDGWFVEHHGRLVPLKYTWVRCNTEKGEPRWTFFSISGTELGPELWSVNVLSDMLADQKRAVSEYAEVVLTDQDERTRAALERLVLGICLTLSQPDHGALVPKAAPKRPKGTNAVLWAKQQVGVPLAKGYVFGKPVSVDCRADVRDYLSGRNTHEITVRSIVRRHWKMQPCGPGRQDRKAIVVAPYERGPKGSAQVVRPHRVKEISNENATGTDRNRES